MEYHETDEYKARVEHEALNVADDYLRGKFGAHTAAELAYDIIGSMTNEEFINQYVENYADIPHILKKKVSKMDFIVEIAEQRVRDEDRLDAEQVALEADEAAYATAYGGDK